MHGIGGEQSGDYCHLSGDPSDPPNPPSGDPSAGGAYGKPDDAAGYAPISPGNDASRSSAGAGIA